jgi:hypothetical protein
MTLSKNQQTLAEKAALRRIQRRAQKAAFENTRPTAVTVEQVRSELCRVSTQKTKIVCQLFDLIDQVQINIESGIPVDAKILKAKLEYIVLGASQKGNN